MVLKLFRKRGFRHALSAFSLATLLPTFAPAFALAEPMVDEGKRNDYIAEMRDENMEQAIAPKKPKREEKSIADFENYFPGIFDTNTFQGQKATLEYAWDKFCKENNISKEKYSDDFRSVLSSLQRGVTTFGEAKYYLRQLMGKAYLEKHGWTERELEELEKLDSSLLAKAPQIVDKKGFLEKKGYEMLGDLANLDGYNGEEIKKRGIEIFGKRNEHWIKLALMEMDAKERKELYNFLFNQDTHKVFSGYEEKAKEDDDFRRFLTVLRKRIRTEVARTFEISPGTPKEKLLAVVRGKALITADDVSQAFLEINSNARYYLIKRSKLKDLLGEESGAREKEETKPLGFEKAVEIVCSKKRDLYEIFDILRQLAKMGRGESKQSTTGERMEEEGRPAEIDVGFTEGLKKEMNALISPESAMEKTTRELRVVPKTKGSRWKVSDNKVVIENYEVELKQEEVKLLQILFSASPIVEDEIVRLCMDIIKDGERRYGGDKEKIQKNLSLVIKGYLKLITQLSRFNRLESIIRERDNGNSIAGRVAALYGTEIRKILSCPEIWFTYRDLGDDYLPFFITNYVNYLAKNIDVFVTAVSPSEQVEMAEAFLDTLYSALRPEAGYVDVYTTIIYRWLYDIGVPPEAFSDARQLCNYLKERYKWGQEIYDMLVDAVANKNPVKAYELYQWLVERYPYLRDYVRPYSFVDIFFPPFDPWLFVETIGKARIAVELRGGKNIQTTGRGEVAVNLGNRGSFGFSYFQDENVITSSAYFQNPNGGGMASVRITSVEKEGVTQKVIDELALRAGYGRYAALIQTTTIDGEKRYYLLFKLEEEKYVTFEYKPDEGWMRSEGVFDAANMGRANVVITALPEGIKDLEIGGEKDVFGGKLTLVGKIGKEEAAIGELFTRGGNAVFSRISYSFEEKKTTTNAFAIIKPDCYSIDEIRTAVTYGNEKKFAVTTTFKEKETKVAGLRFRVTPFFTLTFGSEEGTAVTAGAFARYQSKEHLYYYLKSVVEAEFHKLDEDQKELITRYLLSLVRQHDVGVIRLAGATLVYAVDSKGNITISRLERAKGFFHLKPEEKLRWLDEVYIELTGEKLDAGEKYRAKTAVMIDLSNAAQLSFSSNVEMLILNASDKEEVKRRVNATFWSLLAFGYSRYFYGIARFGESPEITGGLRVIEGKTEASFSLTYHENKLILDRNGKGVTGVFDYAFPLPIGRMNRLTLMLEYGTLRKEFGGVWEMGVGARFDLPEFYSQLCMLFQKAFEEKAWSLAAESGGTIYVRGRPVYVNVKGEATPKGDYYIYFTLTTEF